MNFIQQNITNNSKINTKKNNLKLIHRHMYLSKDGYDDTALVFNKNSKLSNLLRNRSYNSNNKPILNTTFRGTSFTKNTIIKNNKITNNISFKYKPYIFGRGISLICIGIYLKYRYYTHFTKFTIFKKNYTNHKNKFTTLITTFFENINTNLNKEPLNLSYMVMYNTLNKLTLYNPNILFLNNLYNHSKHLIKKNYNYLFILKKRKYSFIKPNQIKFNLLKRKSSIILHNTINTKTLLNNSLMIINHSKSKTEIFSQNTHKGNNFIVNNSLNIIKTPLINNINEVRLNRIKFKPGYQRI